MKRRLYTAALLCALLMTGCAPEVDTPPNSDPVTEEEPAEESSGRSEADLDSMLDSLIESIQENNSGGHIAHTPADQADSEQADEPVSTAEVSAADPEQLQPVFESLDGYAAVIGFEHVPADPEAVLTVPAELGGLPVTAVGRYGFYGATYAGAVQLPDTVTEMDDYAFNGSGIKAFSYVPAETLTAGNHVCSDCAALETVSLGGRAYTFGDYCFEHCALQTFTAEDTVLALGNDCFKALEQLKTLTFSGELTTGDSCFRKCTTLSEITLNGSTLTLGEHSFQNTGIRELDLSDCTGTLGAECFADCAELRRVTIGEGITSLGAYAFSGCPLLRTAELPAALTDIAEGCFSDCPELTVIAPADSAAYQFAEQNGLKVMAAE